MQAMLKIIPLAVSILLLAIPVAGQDTTQNKSEDEKQEYDKPPLPEGLTLEETLQRAAQKPPDNFPAPVVDDRIYSFTLFDRFSYQAASGSQPNRLFWEAMGWVGNDYNRFFWKNETVSLLEGRDQGESETDLLYSRLITPFWSIQAGMQYANEWHDDEYEDRFSGVIALQGLAPYKFELDTSLYLSEDGDVTLEFEGEYDLRITQRLVLQPSLGFGLSAQDIPERRLGSGLTAVSFDMRLRYEYKRELAPYIGFSYSSLIGDTYNYAKEAHEETDELFFLSGIRFAF